MHDRDDAPHGATAQPSPEIAALIPQPHEWPDDDAPTIEHARFYRDCLGAEVFCTPSSADELSYAKRLRDDAVRDYRETHGGADPDEDKACQMWDDARDEAASGAKGAAGWAVRLLGDRTATDADLARMWPVRDPANPVRPRGICVRLGVSRIGLHLAQVDTDPRHGGDITGPWATLPGLRASTPGGGVHCFVVGVPGLRGSAGRDAVSPGVEVRVDGFAVLPAGRASPGRAWLDRTAPVDIPAPLVQAGAAASQRRRTKPGPSGAPGDREAAPWEDGATVGRLAYVLASDVDEGDRNETGKTIVGMLARPGALPDDAVASAVRLLGEYGVGQDWSAARIAEEAARWRLLMTRGPRDAEFAAEVVQTWIAVRDVSPRPWKPGKARAYARSNWKTADRREEGRAGAEDPGYIGGVGDAGPAPWAVPARAPDPEAFLDRLMTERRRAEGSTPIVPAAPAPSLPAPIPPPAPAPPMALSSMATIGNVVQAVAAAVAPPPAPPLPSAADADAQRERIEVGVDAAREAWLRSILPTLGEAYPLESLRRDMAAKPIRIDCLYPFWDFWRVEEERHEDDYGNTPVGHGYGRWAARAIGGLREGDFKALGAAGAKAGKTHFLGQMLEGLALGTAARILGVAGYADAPVVLPIWVSEMPKEGELWLRMLARHMGFDMAAVADGVGATEALGVLHMAALHETTPGVVVKHANAVAEFYAQDEKSPLGWALRHLVREIDLSKFPLPKGTGRQRVDASTGPSLIGYLADAVAIYRRDLAARAGVPEDQVLPIIALDPGQRFTGDDESSKVALDNLLGAVIKRICRRRSGLGACAIMTSDTTKDAAKNVDVNTFLSAPGQSLAASIFAGSQAIMHNADVIAVCAEDTGIPYRRTQWVRVLQGRTGAPAEAFPFAWEPHLGRFRPRASEPLRAAAPGGPGGGHARSGSRGAAPPAPAGGVGEHPAGRPFRMPPRAGLRGRGVYGPADD